MGRVRRILRVRDKLIYSGAIYHITQRAPGKEILFLEEGDYLHMLHLLKEVSRKYEIDIFSFCLMPNHIHILLRISKENLSQAMNKVFRVYATHFNKKYQRKGHVFCGRYAAALCEDESYFFTIVNYIHLNPFKARLCQSPLEYRWSSVGVYTKKINNSFLNVDQLLKMLDSNPKKARNIYKDILLETSAVHLKKFIFRNSEINAFKENLRKILDRIEGLREITNKIFKNSTELSANIFKGKRLRNNEKKLARKYLIQQLRSEGYSVAEIAEKLSVSRQSIHLTLQYSPGV